MKEQDRQEVREMIANAIKVFGEVIHTDGPVFINMADNKLGHWVSRIANEVKQKAEANALTSQALGGKTIDEVTRGMKGVTVDLTAVPRLFTPDLVGEKIEWLGHAGGWHTCTVDEVWHNRRAADVHNEHGGTYALHVTDCVEWCIVTSADLLVATLMQDDVLDMCEALGLGRHARPESCHQVIQSEIIPEIRRLVEKARPMFECPACHRKFPDEGYRVFTCPNCLGTIARVGDAVSITYDMSAFKKSP